MVLIVPIPFEGLVNGIELGRTASWDDLQKANTVQAGQLNNALALETFNANVNNANNNAQIIENNSILSGLGLEQQLVAQPGNLIDTRSRTEAIAQYAPTYRQLQGENTVLGAQQQGRVLNAQLEAPVVLNSAGQYLPPWAVDPLRNASTVTPTNNPNLYPQGRTATTPTPVVGPTPATGPVQGSQTPAAQGQTTDGTTVDFFANVPQSPAAISLDSLGTIGVDQSIFDGRLPNGTYGVIQQNNGIPTLFAYVDANGNNWLVYANNGRPTQKVRVSNG